DGADGGMDVPDVCLAVPDDCRELDEPRAEAPDEPERRPDPDVLLRLRALRRRAVERPLQARLVDPNRLRPALPEVGVDADSRVAACRDADTEPAPWAGERRHPVPVRTRLPPE